jgi:hypothetical protein
MKAIFVSFDVEKSFPDVDGENLAQNWMEIWSRAEFQIPLQNVEQFIVYWLEHAFWDKAWPLTSWTRVTTAIIFTENVLPKLAGHFSILQHHSYWKLRDKKP